MLMLQIILLIMAIRMFLRKRKLNALRAEQFGATEAKFCEWRQLELKHKIILLWAAVGLLVGSIAAQLAVVVDPDPILRIQMDDFQLALFVLFFILLTMSVVPAIMAAKINKQFNINWP